MKKIEEILEEALRKEPDFDFKSGFHDQVIRKIRKHEKSHQQWLYGVIMAGTLTIFGIGAVLVSYFGGFEMLKDMGQIVPMAILLGIIVVIIQFLDKKLVKDKLINQLAR